MSNPANMGVVTGHLAADPVVFPNNDGSCTVKVTVYADNNYVNKTTNQVDSEKVPLEKYIPSGRGLGAYEHMKQGDQVSFSYSLRSNEYTDADGNRVYKGLVARIDSQKLLTSKAQSEARRAQRQSNAQAQNAQNTQNTQQQTQAQPQYQQPSGQQNQQTQQQGAIPPSNAYQGNQQQNQGYQQQAQPQQQNQPQGYGFGNTTQSQSMANAPQYNQTYNPGQNYQNNQQGQQSGQQSGQSDNVPF